MADPFVSALSSVGSSTPTQSSTAARSSGAAASGEDFDNMLTRMVSDAIDTLKGAEAVSISGVKEKASAQQVVESVMAAEQSLQTAIAIRDKVVAAYLEVSRMTI